ncbi:MAG: PPOX class F420-dependent oxidoreductase [Candidatus Nanopelagicales bacterium]
MSGRVAGVAADSKSWLRGCRIAPGSRGRHDDGMLSDLASELLAAPNFATVATLNADGSVHQSVVWVDTQDEDVVFSTLRGRVKEKNLLRDPRISLLVMDKDNPYRFVAIRGTATLEDEGTSELIQAMAQKYTGQPWQEKAPDVQRVNVVIHVDRCVDYKP